MANQGALHERLTANSDEVKGSSNRSFGLVFAAVFIIVGCLPLIKGDGPRLWSLVVAAGFALAALAFPMVLTPLNRLWTKFGLLLHKIVNPVIMALLFFVVITPYGLLLRLFGKDLLKLAFETDSKSYWIERTPPGPQRDSIQNQF